MFECATLFFLFYCLSTTWNQIAQFFIMYKINYMESHQKDTIKVKTKHYQFGAL